MKIDHARILNAYLSQMTISDLEHIFFRSKMLIHASMNCESKEITQCRVGFYGAVANATNNLIEHNVNYIEQVINEEIGECHANNS